MYDYISIRKDKEHSEYASVYKVVEISRAISGLNRIGNVSFSANIGKFQVIIKCIYADSNGNYAYKDDHEFTKVNLIEFDIPQGAETIHGQEILSLAKAFAVPLKWEIEDHETGMLLYEPKRA